MNYLVVKDVFDIIVADALKTIPVTSLWTDYPLCAMSTCNNPPLQSTTPRKQPLLPHPQDTHPHHNNALTTNLPHGKD